jgi:hypothetical protein
LVQEWFKKQDFLIKNLSLLVDGLFANFVGLIFAFGEDGL